jgi:hypothetical protein
MNQVREFSSILVSGEVGAIPADFPLPVVRSM